MKRDLVSPVEGKVVYYRPDGTGRDQYIKNDNGGLLSHDAVHRLKPKPLPQRSRMIFGSTYKAPLPPKWQNNFVHYISDGSGRDFYVTNNEGGNSNVHRWRDQVDFRFKSTLRDYQKLRLANPQNEDIFRKSQLTLTRTESIRNRTLSMEQFNQTMRLSQPKSVKKPPPVSTYFPSFYNRSRVNRLCQHSPKMKQWMPHDD